MTVAVATMRWCDDRLLLIDQRVLPSRLEYVACASAAEVAAAIRTMVVRGAPAIGCAAAHGVAVEALRLSTLDGAAFAVGLERGLQLLAASRPTAINLGWAIARMRAVIASNAGLVPAALAARLIAEAAAIQDEDIRINRAMGRLGAELLADGARVLTHCNAGALATAGHGTALGVIRSAVEAGKRISVVANETRPFLQGARLTAWELVQERIPVTLITDGMSGHLMQQGQIDAIIVGADRIAANGDFANKIGTYMVAVLARRHRLPFYVACPLSSIDLEVASGAGIPIEERNGVEVTGFGEVRWAAEGIAVRNPAFDVTPADLVTALITERAVVPAPDRAKIASLFAAPPRAGAAHG